jgi:hypothetical protein
VVHEKLQRRNGPGKQPDSGQERAGRILVVDAFIGVVALFGGFMKGVDNSTDAPDAASHGTGGFNLAAGASGASSELDGCHHQPLTRAGDARHLRAVPLPLQDPVGQAPGVRRRLGKSQVYSLGPIATGAGCPSRAEVIWNIKRGMMAEREERYVARNGASYPRQPHEGDSPPWPERKNCLEAPGRSLTQLLDEGF